MSHEYADHLKFFAELGVDGISRDPAWRTRAATVAANGPRSSEPTSAFSVGSVPSPGGQTPPRGTGPGAGDRPRNVAAPADSTQMLAMLKTDIGHDCQRCKLHALGRKQIVFGIGNPSADLMFVGEAPGADEDEQGQPFVGRAGQLLTKIIEAIGLQRDDVYIANIIKCRPPGNRNPEPDEVEQCEPFLFRQVEAIKPKVIVALGKFAAQSLLRTTDPITRLRGRSFNYRGATLIPTFHPAYLLRNPSAKREVWDDMKKVRGILQGHE